MIPTDARDDEQDIQRLADELQRATRDELVPMVRTLRSRPDGQVLGAAEFRVRDLAHKVAAKAVEAEVNRRQRGATPAPASAARPAASRPSSKATGPGRSLG